ncbi:MAG TPA: PadR family transcriptional regulator [Bacillota bacterium]|nr:PadR family transcriptional regulator [Bacillota bacterium]
MKTKNKTRYVILGLLSEGPLSGYEIKKLVTLRFSGFWSESYGQIYPELKRLETDGLVTKTNSDSNRTRFLYSITEKGLENLKLWLHEPPEKELIRYEILLKLYFGHLEDPKKMAEYISDFRNEHLQALRQLEFFAAEIRGILGDHSNHPYVLMTIAFGQKVYSAYLEWCEEVLKQLADKPTYVTDFKEKGG